MKPGQTIILNSITPMLPSDDDYDINYGPDGLVSDEMKEQNRKAFIEKGITTAKIKTAQQLHSAAKKLARKESDILYPVLALPKYKQARADSCIIACILSITRYFHIAASEDSIVRAYQDHYVGDGSGTSYQDAHKFLEYLGLEAQWVDSDSESLIYQKQQGNPVLMDIRLRKNMGHGMVAAGFDDRYVYFMDPAIGDFIKFPIKMHDEIVAESSAAAISVKAGTKLRLAV